MKVENMKSPRTGRDVPNQFIIIANTGQYFQSYESIIAFVPFVRNQYSTKGVQLTDYPNASSVKLDKTYWNYSKTTSKYRNIFLGETTAETQAKIDSGEYILTNLN